tara:strand:- start:174 stop:581 length:408 start_codon:yes stop_codon:yes gene_type:complete
MQKATNKVVELKTQEKQPWEQEWARCKPFIEKAVKYQDSYTINDIEDKIRSGIFHLWPGKRSAYITEFVLYPQVKALNLLFCGGDYKELEQMLPSIESFAKAAGIKRLYGGGRKGWIRKIKHLGFETEYLIRKDL